MVGHRVFHVKGWRQAAARAGGAVLRTCGIAQKQKNLACASELDSARGNDFVIKTQTQTKDTDATNNNNVARRPRQQAIPIGNALQCHARPSFRMYSLVHMTWPGLVRRGVQAFPSMCITRPGPGPSSPGGVLRRRGTGCPDNGDHFSPERKLLKDET